MIVLAAMVMGLVAAQALVSQGSFRLEELTDRAGRLEARQGRLEARVAGLTTPRRVARAARRAGLKLPGRMAMVSPPRAGSGTEAPPPADATLALKAGGE
jgi:hypothetical protein